MLSKLEIIKTISVTLFFCVLSWCVWDFQKFLKTEISENAKFTQALLTDLKSETLHEVSNLRKSTENQVSNLRKDTFEYLYATNDTLDTRIQSIEGKLDTQLTKANNTISEFGNTAKSINTLVGRVDVETNCDINDQCWQNLTTDLLIDGRNVAKDGAESFRMVNKQFPIIATDVTKISNVFAKEIPIVSSNVTKTSDNLVKLSDHLQRITKPRWYDRLIGYGLNSALIYNNFRTR